MKTPARILVTLFTALTVSACSTVDVTTDYDRTATFPAYKTYTLAPAPNSGRKLLVYCEMALRKAIRTELEARGLMEAKGPNADLAIVWHGYRTDKTSVREIADTRSDFTWDYEYGYYTSWAGAPANFSNSTPYPDGTLILDVVDMRTKTLVFRGSGTAVAMGPEKCASNVTKAVTKMIAALPAKRP